MAPLVAEVAAVGRRRRTPSRLVPLEAGILPGRHLAPLVALTRPVQPVRLEQGRSTPQQAVAVAVAEGQQVPDEQGRTEPTTAVAVAVAAMGHQPYMTPAPVEMAPVDMWLWSRSDGLQPAQHTGIRCKRNLDQTNEPRLSPR
jgi:hypothetical protein